MSERPVRVGDTLRRPATRSTPAVQALLAHLHAAGFDGAPRPLGTDRDGREVLSWIDGTTTPKPWPASLRRTDGLVALVSLVRRFHDASRTFHPSAELVWFGDRRQLARGQSVIHRDLNLGNVIWRGDAPVALIDWEFAGPGHPLDDLAELALNAVPLRDDDYARDRGLTLPVDRSTRLRLLCDTYGDGATPTDLIDRAEAHWTEDIHMLETAGVAGIEPWATWRREGLVDHCLRLVAWLQANRSTVS